MPAVVFFFLAEDNPTGLFFAVAALFGGIYVFWKHVLSYAIRSVKGARGAYKKTKESYARYLKTPDEENE